jgi:hypothetical protein
VGERINFNASILGTLLARIYVLFSRVVNGKMVWELLIAADILFKRKLCSKSNRFGFGRGF